MSDVADRIEKKIHLRAKRSRVWRAISDAREFGTWFGVEFDSGFTPGRRVTGRITPTKVDPEVAALQEAHAGKAFEISIDIVEPEQRFAFLWHPYAVEPGVDYSQEPMTRVLFELEETADGTLLTLTESGFSKLPPARRAAAFTANDGGWTHQARLLEKYLAAYA